MRRALFFIQLLLVCALGFDVKAEGSAACGVRTIVIDAGHGGPRFPGARYGNVCEKDINLKVALKLGALIEKGMPQVKVVYTRKVEKQFSSVLTDDLQARADIANNAGGDLFISIHSNAARNSAVCGVETLIMGETSMETRINEQALYLNNKEELLDMSDQKTAAIVRAYIQNLQYTYGEYSEMMARLVQKHYVKLGRSNRGVRKQPLKVLYATDMPSVLTEIGFMSNPKELAYITSEKGQNELAGALYAAVKDYTEYVRKTLLVDEPQSTPAQSAAIQPAEPKTEQPKAEQPKPAEPKAEPEPKVEQPKPEQPKPAEPKAEQSKSSAPKSEQPKTEQPKSEPSKSGLHYAVQIMASAKQLSLSHAEFGEYRGRVAEVLADGSFPYKYCVGEHADRASAQATVAEIRKRFPSAFVVAVRDGRIAK